MSAKLKLVGAGLQSALYVLRRIDRMRGTNTGLSVEEFRQNPYESFRRLRNLAPVVRSYANQGWMVTGYQEAQEILRDTRFSNDVRRNRFFMNVLRVGMGGKPIPFVDHPTMLNMDPPDHTRLRRLAATGFINSYIQSLAPRIETLLDELLDSVTDQTDIVQSIAKPLPALVIAEMLGVPAEDRHLFQQWSDDLTGATVLGRPDLMRRASDAEVAMRTYLTGLLQDKKANPREDFISILVEAHEGQDRLSHEELLSTCVLLLSAGHETTTRLIGNGLYTLLTHPDQYQVLKQQPDRMSAAIEEMLRYEPPIQMTIRFLSQNVKEYGVNFRKNQMTLVCIAGANRDPRQFSNPDQFDITREDNRHLAFGHGIHLCLGMALARLEGKIVFSRLLEEYSELELLDPEPLWGFNPFFRDLGVLPVALRK